MAQQIPNLETLWQLALKANRREDHISCSSICTAILSQPGLTLFELGQTSNVLSRLPARLGARDHADRAIELFGRVLRGDSGSSDQEQIWAMRAMVTVMERSMELRGEGDSEKEGDEEGDWDEDEDERDDEGTIPGKELGREKLGQQESRSLIREDTEHPQMTTTAIDGALEDGVERHSEVGDEDPQTPPAQLITPGASTQEAQEREKIKHQRRQTHEASQSSRVTPQEKNKLNNERGRKAQVLELRMGVWRVSFRA